MDPSEIFNYWHTVGIWKMIRVFWYFIIFEMTRYVIFEYVVLIIYKLTNKSRQAKREKAKQKLWAEMPLISLIAPGKNEGKNLFKLVKSLSEQTYKKIEIIIQLFIVDSI